MKKKKKKNVQVGVVLGEILWYIDTDAQWEISNPGVGGGVVGQRPLIIRPGTLIVVGMVSDTFLLLKKSPARGFLVLEGKYFRIYKGCAL